MAPPVYPLTLHKTYYNNGFFNLGVEVDRHVRPDNGLCVILLGDTRAQMAGRIDRTANPNNTPRVFGGAKLRDWFRRTFAELDRVDVVIEGPAVLRLRKPRE